MRLHLFIQENMEPLLSQWEDFARVVWPAGSPCKRELRDHAQEILHAIINDLQTTQSEGEQHDKSVGIGNLSASSENVDLVSVSHAAQRLDAGFEISALLAEFRALRASVLHLWSKSAPGISDAHIQDITRFNECIDQLLAKSVQSYSDSVEHSRELFLGILGHDLRTPLSAVSIMAGLLNEYEDLNFPYCEMASRIVIGSREMKRLVDDLLDFAGSRMGVKMHITRQPMNLEELSREVLQEMETTYPSRVFDLEISGDVNGEWDRPRLRQLISNLIANSVQHGAAEAPVRLFITAHGDVVELEVCNQGPPIPPGLQTAMFDPLCRNACYGSVRKMGGLGLGLYIAKEVANAHDGSIAVHSDDRETAFIVKLPQWQTNGTAGDSETYTNDSASALRTQLLETSVA